MLLPTSSFLFVFFFNDTATTEIYTLSLHDALPISFRAVLPNCFPVRNLSSKSWALKVSLPLDRKSTRLNSSHEWISYAVFCLKKKKKRKHQKDRIPRPIVRRTHGSVRGDRQAQRLE